MVRDTKIQSLLCHLLGHLHVADLSQGDDAHAPQEALDFFLAEPNAFFQESTSTHGSCRR